MPASLGEMHRGQDLGMQPHPDLTYKRNETTMVCQFREQIIALAFRMKDGSWELNPVCGDRTVHESWATALDELRAWARGYAWAQTTVH